MKASILSYSDVWPNGLRTVDGAETFHVLRRRNAVARQAASINQSATTTWQPITNQKNAGCSLRKTGCAAAPITLASIRPRKTQYAT